jgi:hypothetical protein
VKKSLCGAPLPDLEATFLIPLEAMLALKKETTSLIPDFLDERDFDYLFEISTSCNDTEKDGLVNLAKNFVQPRFHLRIARAGMLQYFVRIGFKIDHAKSAITERALSKFIDFMSCLTQRGFGQKEIIGQWIYLHNNSDQEDGKIQQIVEGVNSVASSTIKSRFLGDLAHLFGPLRGFVSPTSRIRSGLRMVVPHDLGAQTSSNTISYQFGHVSVERFRELVANLEARWSPVAVNKPCGLDEGWADYILKDARNKSGPSVVTLVRSRVAGPLGIASTFPKSGRGLCIFSFCADKNGILLPSFSCRTSYRSFLIPREHPFTLLRNFCISYYVK